jgi:hypothetical protein
VLGGLGFLAIAFFFAWIDGRLRADDDGTVLPTVALVAAVTTVALGLMGVVLQGLLARHGAGLDDSSLLLAYRTWSLIFFQGPPIAQTLYLTVVGARVVRTAVFPRWLGVVGIIGGLAGGL